MDAKTLANNPAYPVIGAPGASQDYGGITTRELFAAMAMQGMLSNANLEESTTNSALARISATIADELIAELAKDQP